MIRSIMSVHRTQAAILEKREEDESTKTAHWIDAGRGKSLDFSGDHLGCGNPIRRSRSA
jgi:hypothetical protein